MAIRRVDLIVRGRAGDRCEYCHLPQWVSELRFQIDHIISQQHGGATNAANLALCCARCNRYKGPNLAGIDPVTRRMTRLFHPRRDKWDANFRWKRAVLVGLTPVGRATISVLVINHADDVATRQEMIAAGEFRALL